MIIGGSIFVILLLVGITLIGIKCYKNNIHLWLPGHVYVSLAHTPRPNSERPIDIMFCFVDHYEPHWKDYQSMERAAARIETWLTGYPELAARHQDADGRPPQHTFFYPAEDIHRKNGDIFKMCQAFPKEGLGEVEIHLHHGKDTPESLKKKLIFYRDRFAEHGFLAEDREGNIRYAFIHGGWALDNSGIDYRWCGVNSELQILKETGCYADFTLPSAPDLSQTRKINSIYYAIDDPDRPKSHDTGIDAAAGKKPVGDLLIIQGPLALNWRNRKWGIFPALENADVSYFYPPTRERIDLWIKQHICVKGQPNWIFVKVHTHGCQDVSFETLLGETADKMYAYLEEKYNDGTRFRLHYATSREMYNIIKAAEAGLSGNPNQYRDYLLVPQT